MPERKSHVKSRHGCAQCKSRRVKCDEVRPICGNCTRRQESCSYTSVKRNASPSSHSPGGCESAGSISTALHLKQLELMHQWSTSTCFTLAMPSTGVTRHQIELPRLAIEHQCLLDTMFALTSLHLATLRPDDAPSYVADAMHYQARAFASTRLKLENLTGPECEALYHASGQLGALALAFRSVDPEAAKLSKPTETLAQLYKLWRGTHWVLQASECLVGPETLSSFLPNVDWSQSSPSALTSQSRKYLDLLRERAESADFESLDNPPGVSTDAIRSAYLGAIEQLNATFHAKDPDYSRILAWLILCPLPFIECLSHGQLLAKAIILLYTLMMADFDDEWWTKDIRQQLVDELAPDVASADSEMAELAEYVQSWTRPARDAASMRPPHDSGVSEIAQWVENHSIKDQTISTGLYDQA